MEGLTFSASRQSGSTELRNATPVSPVPRVAQPPTDDSTEDGKSTSDEKPASAAAAPHVTQSQSSFQARLNYDRENATVFIEILDPTSGDALQRIPAESAADRIHELTGGYGGSVLDKFA
jgi:hypothetical protein